MMVGSASDLRPRGVAEGLRRYKSGSRRGGSRPTSASQLWNFLSVPRGQFLFRDITNRITTV
jgi:hypothetical protein